MSIPWPKVETLVDLLQWRAQHNSDKVAYTFLVDGENNEVPLTYQALDYQARAIATELQQRGLTGRQALLLYPSGLEYIAAFFGCLYAGVLAVPVPHIKRADKRLETIAEDAAVSVVLTKTDVLAFRDRISANSSRLQNVMWLNTDAISTEGNNLASIWQPPDISTETLAFLQYTSGSTGSPKGVMISHQNLLHNQEMIIASFDQNDYECGVSWLPFYHDMGLIGALLYTISLGAHCILMSPAAFIQKPSRWLQAMSKYRATTSGGPNFSYELCIDRIQPESIPDLDLSRWETAFNGAEPIRADTLSRFAEKFGPYGFRYEAFHTCYGLAESTLFVTATPKLVPPDIDQTPSKSHVSCGQTWLDQEIVIVDPVTLQPCAEGEEGEIWLAGPSTAQGYWNKSAETADVFQAHLAGDDDRPFLRTGDLGHLKAGQLYVTGRIKDLIIIRGRNIYPQDIELSIEQSHPALRSNGGAVFSIEHESEEVLVAVHEINRNHLRQVDLKETTDAIRRAVSQHHQLKLHSILLLKPLTLPTTSSGKIQRYLCRDQFLQGQLQLRAVQANNQHGDSRHEPIPEKSSNA